jgi:hypothetical protein
MVRAILLGFEVEPGYIEHRLGLMWGVHASHACVFKLIRRKF